MDRILFPWSQSCSGGTGPFFLFVLTGLLSDISFLIFCLQRRLIFLKKNSVFLKPYIENYIFNAVPAYQKGKKSEDQKIE